MQFTAIQMRFLQDLHTLKPTERNTSAAADHFSAHYGLGRRTRAGYLYTTDDHALARNLLVTHRLPLAAEPKGTRADSARHDMSEKVHSVAPHADSIAIKTLGNCTLNGRSVWTPPGTHLIVRGEDGARFVCDAVMVVENFEPFRRLEEYDCVPTHENVLVIYRGDLILSPKSAGELIAQRTEPVLGFFDYDPSGLVLALHQPRLERLIHPPLEWLKTQGRTSRGRGLFHDQIGQCERTLDATTHPAIRPAWQAMSAMGGAVTQEQMHAYRRVKP